MRYVNPVLTQTFTPSCCWLLKPLKLSPPIPETEPEPSGGHRSVELPRQTGLCDRWNTKITKGYLHKKIRMVTSPPPVSSRLVCVIPPCDQFAIPLNALAYAYREMSMALDDVEVMLAILELDPSPVDRGTHSHSTEVLATPHPPTPSCLTPHAFAPGPRSTKVLAHPLPPNTSHLTPHASPPDTPPLDVHPPDHLTDETPDPTPALPLFWPSESRGDRV